SHKDAGRWRESFKAIDAISAVVADEKLPLLARQMVEASLLEILSRPAWAQNPRKVSDALKTIEWERPLVARRLSSMLAGGAPSLEQALAEDPAPPAAPARPAAPMKARCRMALRNGWDLVRYGWGRVVAF
ncbi:MAG TPA: hypothetical protein VM598_00600, partial [Bdellovibrionota bacterium]|nr:hypothetical protein [Bdellovibrionota bacterium]